MYSYLKSEMRGLVFFGNGQEEVEVDGVQLCCQCGILIPCLSGEARLLGGFGTRSTCFKLFERLS